MKLKSTLASVALIVGAVFFITPAPAVAGECSASDPCQTYAMVDANGTVTNIIVCQPSVCGSGTFAGSRVVPQVAANPVTHENQGGWNTGGGITVKESSGTFTVQTGEKTEVYSEVSGNTATTLVTTVATTARSFTYEDTINSNGQIAMKDVAPETNTAASLYASQITLVDTATVETKESISFTERKTIQQVSDILDANNLSVLKYHIAKLRRMLSAWSI